MTWKVYRKADADIRALTGRSVAVIGYGNQGRAHALNLRDSGINVLVGQRPGRSADQAVADGFSPCEVDQAAGSDLVILTLPDESAAEVYDAQIVPSLRPGQTLGFVHGFNIRFGFIRPPAGVDVVMVAPKGPGSLLRSLYLEGRGLPALFAIHQDASGRAKETSLAWAAGIGCTRAGVVETTFAAETEADLFGEQAVLCGGLTALAGAAFETLVQAGYAPELAYLECVHELKQIVDLLYARGLTGMRQAISNTAEYGDLTRGPRLIDASVRQRLQQILGEIRDGTFAREWIDEWKSGARRFRKLREGGQESQLEQAGRAVRDLMPWLADAASAEADRPLLPQA